MVWLECNQFDRYAWWYPSTNDHSSGWLIVDLIVNFSVATSNNDDGEEIFYGITNSFEKVKNKTGERKIDYTFLSFDSFRKKCSFVVHKCSVWRWRRRISIRIVWMNEQIFEFLMRKIRKKFQSETFVKQRTDRK